MTRSQLFPPHLNARETAEEVVELPGGLKAFIKESEPYEKITYEVNGELLATEFVGSAEERLEEVRADPGVLVTELTNFRLAVY